VPEPNDAQTSSHGTEQSTSEKTGQRALSPHSEHTFLEGSASTPMPIEQHIAAEK
jgi:hypothetical protein